MCEAVGHPVEQLTRIGIGPITDAGLKPGQSRDLTAGGSEGAAESRQPFVLSCPRADALGAGVSGPVAAGL